VTGSPETIPYRTAGEWTLQSRHTYTNPFTDVAVNASFTSPSGETLARRIPTWRRKGPLR
jgi:hypothetical protein